MDCDTTGIEPDVALVKYKKLVGGGMLKIVNNSVPRALRNLGYSEEDIATIVQHIDQTDTIEGCSIVKSEHLPIFDCAFPAANGDRSIHYMGHVRMMAASQPFVSGAISKTVNMPTDSTVEDIYNTYVEAWKLGLKAVAIYRDGSKRSQPLSTSKDEVKEAVEAEISQRPQRRHLPDERQAITHKFNIAGHEGYITVGLYEDGTPGEIFLVMAKEGSTLSGVMDAYATSISLALQYGVPLAALVRKFSHMRFEPSGFTPNKQIPYAKSILDYIFRWLGSRFLPMDEQVTLGIRSPEEAAEEGKKSEEAAPAKKADVQPGKTSAKSSASNKKVNGSANGGTSSGGPETLTNSMQALPYVSDDAPPCSVCGSSLMVRQGACYRCLNCGAQGGCG
jgi:ribonucleoside-diphosphate reductase alpha chain